MHEIAIILAIAAAVAVLIVEQLLSSIGAGLDALATVLRALVALVFLLFLAFVGLGLLALLLLVAAP